MRAGPGFRRCRLFAFPMPSSRLRHVFVTPSVRLRGRCCNALRLNNLRSDSPLDSAHFGRCYLDSIGALNAFSTLGSVAASAVVRANGVRGQLFGVASSGKAPVQDPISRCGLERRDNRLSINVSVHDFAQHLPSSAREEERSACETCSATPIKCALVFAQGTTGQMIERSSNYVAKSWSNTF